MAESDTGTVVESQTIWDQNNGPEASNPGVGCMRNGRRQGESFPVLTSSTAWLPAKRVTKSTCWLPKAASSTTVGAVELGPPRLPYPGEHDLVRGLVFARGVPTYTPTFPLTHRRGGITSRAYSSIGQSPRLITGLFLVRTQVGPLAVTPRFM